MGFINGSLGADKSDFPPVPEWEPKIVMPTDRVIDRFRYYTTGKKDFVVFSHGTCVIIANGLTDDAAKKEAREILDKIFKYHPDMKPLKMDDGNILVQYNHPAYNVVLVDIVKVNWKEIQAEHERALTRSEVLITPQGPNKFDDFGMMALFGRCYLFMDAKSPQVLRIVRKTASSDKESH
jgi:hypothetical protein